MQLFSLLWDDVKRQNKVKIDIYAAVSIFTKKKEDQSKFRLFF